MPGGLTARGVPRDWRETLSMADVSDTVVFRWLAAGDRGDFDVFDELLHPDVVVHAPRGLSTTSVEAEKAVWVEALAAMPDLCHAVQEVVVEGDVEMARVVVTGTMKVDFAGVEGSGGSFRMDQAVIVHLRDGKVAEAWEIADVAALQAQIADDPTPANP
jgi:ketosteroid isomerase-like protein